MNTSDTQASPVREATGPVTESRRLFDIRHRLDAGRRLDVRPKRLPQSGNVALAAGALIQAVLGIEFLLSGLNKLADRNYVADYAAFVRSSPGAHSGPLAPVIRTLVLPHLHPTAILARSLELGIGVILLVGAAEIARRRFAGRFGAPQGYEAAVALLSSAAGLSMAGLSFSIFLIQGGTAPAITAARAFTSAIPVELLIVPVGLGIAWLEFGRFLVLRRRGVAASRQTIAGLLVPNQLASPGLRAIREE